MPLLQHVKATAPEKDAKPTIISLTIVDKI
jgi:hypothetical protein